VIRSAVLARCASIGRDVRRPSQTAVYVGSDASTAMPLDVNAKADYGLLSEICIHISDTPWGAGRPRASPSAEILGDSRARSEKPSGGRQQPVANSVPDTQPINQSSPPTTAWHAGSRAAFERRRARAASTFLLSRPGSAGDGALCTPSALVGKDYRCSRAEHPNRNHRRRVLDSWRATMVTTTPTAAPAIMSTA
jgi:hypothetical protein